MRILQINILYGRGSTGVIVKEIAQFLESKGHEAYVAYGYGKTSNSKAYKIGSEFEHKFHSLIFSKILGIQGLGSYLSTRRFTKWMDIIMPDIVQLHTLHSHFINIPLLFRYLKKRNIPVVWSFYDCYPFTGKCTHFSEAGCRKWEQQCGQCPYLRLGSRTWFFDCTSKLFDIKKKYCAFYKNLDVIVCSNWLRDEVKKSMYKDHSIHMIYNWIDINKFHPVEDPTLFEKYGLPHSKKIIVSVSALWGDINTRLRDAIELASKLPSEYYLVLIGKLVSNKKLPANIKHIDFINGTEELSKLYTCAEAYVNFSVEDTFGKVMAEAQLCGTPAIVFNATACPEVASDKSLVVPPHDVDAMIQCIKKITSKGKAAYKDTCIKYVKDKFDYRSNVGDYLQVYLDVYNRVSENKY